MKIKSYGFFLIFILLIPFSFAVEFTLKEEVLRGENLIVKVSGEFIRPLTENNIYFYRRHMITSIEPYGVEKIDGDYYIYAQIPFEKEVDNYSIWLKNVEYISGMGTKKDDLFANFTILEGYASFSLNPGIIRASANYFIELRSLSDSRIIINYGEQEKSIVELEQQKPEEEKGFFDSLFGRADKNETVLSEVIKWSNQIELRPGETKKIEFPIEAFIGLKKIKFNYYEENYEVLVFMNGTNYILSKIEDNIKDRGRNDSVPKRNITILDNGTIITMENLSINRSVAAFAESCAVLNGTICKERFVCEGEIRNAKDSICCIGRCVEKKESNTGKTIGWILIIVIVLFLTWFFKQKYRKTSPPPVDLEKIGNK